MKEIKFKAQQMVVINETAKPEQGRYSFKVGDVGTVIYHVLRSKPTIQEENHVSVLVNNVNQWVPVTDVTLINK